MPSEAPGVPCTVLAVWGVAAVFMEFGGALGALVTHPIPSERFVQQCLLPLRTSAF